MVRKKWLSRTAFILALAFIGWAAFVSWKQLERYKRTQADIDALQEQADLIRKQNETLAERVEYFKSSEFREQEAKKKLGLKKPDEMVVALKEERAEEGDAAASSPEDSGTASEKEIYQKWWDIFFSQP